ncbi:hypothetical protein E3V39_00535 [Gammaproteobacteria bacterium LSUCC0112]|nr:hypothetical protein E3V39_00535 [Gammaproteobacteria bacterium LSUCC0112]
MVFPHGVVCPSCQNLSEVIFMRTSVNCAGCSDGA